MIVQRWTIGTLSAGLVIGALLVGVPAAAEDADYVSNAKCKMCHNKKAQGEQWNAWKAMKHAGAFASLSSDQAKEYAVEAGLTTPPSESPECLRCHVTGYDADSKAFHPALNKEHGIQCESCHGPASNHLPFGKKYLTKRDNIPDDAERNIVRPDVSACVKCHNDESPAWDPEKYTLGDGTKAGFDFEQAFAQIAHLNPEKKED